MFSASFGAPATAAVPPAKKTELPPHLIDDVTANMFAKHYIARAAKAIAGSEVSSDAPAHPPPAPHVVFSYDKAGSVGSVLWWGG